ncbi:hypothetical protein N7462_002671 [Penicillium macrosclerotiorum]|uniref:uncharacterized protein n=1 Tax=Penicillium macrosclerotiorum TaxID=303699 RepID=UPI00254994B5|nr:uncharacterized protein N7462_002671 [Penicillium macrosclerotiorum]KAJ5693248.1 hypothetical protein N7462_002671 [Penicillium macrosclerotiorum]
MSIEELIQAIRPLKGEVIPIRTVQETQPPEGFDDAYVAEVNVKAASKVIKALDAAFPRDPSLPLTHLRRFAKRTMLPPTLLAELEANKPTVNHGPTIFVLIAPPLPDVDILLALLAPFAPSTRRPSATPPADKPSSPSSPSSSRHFKKTPTPEPSPLKVRLLKTSVPIYPPFNAAQAEKWSKTLWPVVFNPAAPRATVAPPPQILNRALESIQPRAGHYLALARTVAEEAKQSSRGRGVGAVIVDPIIEAKLETTAWEQNRDSTEHWMDAVVAVAGDARYGRSEAGAPSQRDQHPGVAPHPASKTYDATLEGGPDLHALMRATEFVARRRREDVQHQAETAGRMTSVIASDPQLANQFSRLESHFLYAVGLPATNMPEPVMPSSPRKRKHEEPNPETALNIPATAPEAFNQSTRDLSIAPEHRALSSTGATTISDPTTFPSIIDTALENPTISGTTTPPSSSYIYLSHEPCLCCSMGMLLSRFRAVIFPRSGRMQSGGLASEPVGAPVPLDDENNNHDDNDQIDTTECTKHKKDRKYYGLHWRKELNWRILGFEFVEVNDGAETVDDEADTVFHA